MRKINQEAAKTFQKLIKAMGEEKHARIDNSNGTFMPVHIELLNSNKDLAGRPVSIYSIAHYFEQNGDLVPDPDMVFAVSNRDPDYIWPTAIQTQFYYREGLREGEDGKWSINVREQKDQAIFAGQWMKNIKDQQNL